MNEDQENNSILDELDPDSNRAQSNSSSVTVSKNKKEMFEFNSSSKEEALDELQTALNNIKDQGQLAYISTVMNYPAATDSTVAEILKCSVSKVREYKNSSSVRAFISLYLKIKIANMQLKEIEALDRATDVLDEEFSHRVTDLRNKRYSYEDLLARDIDSKYAKLIMSTRIEGLTTSDLIRGRALLAERKAKAVSIDEKNRGEDSAVIEELSLNYKIYAAKRQKINPKDFSPDADYFGTVIEGKEE